MIRSAVCGPDHQYEIGAKQENSLPGELMERPCSGPPADQCVAEVSGCFDVARQSRRSEERFSECDFAASAMCPSGYQFVAPASLQRRPVRCAAVREGFRCALQCRASWTRTAGVVPGTVPFCAPAAPMHAHDELVLRCSRNEG